MDLIILGSVQYFFDAGLWQAEVVELDQARVLIDASSIKLRNQILNEGRLNQIWLQECRALGMQRQVCGVIFRIIYFLEALLNHGLTVGSIVDGDWVFNDLVGAFLIVVSAHTQSYQILESPRQAGKPYPVWIAC